MNRLTFWYIILSVFFFLSSFFRKSQFGVELACQLRLDDTGTIVLWPQPGDEPDDPQTWSPNRKLKLLIILTMASFVGVFKPLVLLSCPTFLTLQEYKTLIHWVFSFNLRIQVPDFMGAIGIAALFGLAQEFKTTPTVINNVTSKSVEISPFLESLC